MKTLLLVRHAKSDWNHEGLSDKERPLNERGKKDAPEMAQRVKKKIKKIDLLICSDAKRAHKTATYFAKAFDVDEEDIQVEPTLYEAATPAYKEVIKTLADKHSMVALFAHNPTITDYANRLTTVQTDNVPTCGVFAVQAEATTWAEFVDAQKAFLFYDYPKNPLADM